MSSFNALRAMTCVGIGALTVVGGGILTAIGGGAAAAAAPVAAGAAIAMLLGGAASNIGSGIIGGAVHNGLKDGFSTVAKQLALAAERGRLPHNHDILRALRRSHLNALQFIATRHEATAADPQGDDRDPNRRWTQKLNKWIEAELKAAETDGFLASADFQAVTEEFGRLVRTTTEQDAPSRLATISNAGAEAAIHELEEALGDVPASFRDAFFGRPAPSVNWLHAAHAFFAEKMKSDERLRTVVFSERMTGVEASLAALSQALRDRDDGLDQRLRAIEHAIAMLGDRAASRPDFEALTASMAVLAGRLTDLGALEARLLAVARAQTPLPDWEAFRAAEDSQERYGELRRRFFGRESELRALNTRVDGADQSLSLMTAEAGAGKSALMAAFCDLRRRSGDRVVQHFASRNRPATAEPLDVLRHLARQLGELDSDVREIPDTEGRLLDLIAGKLARDRTDGRLILVVDGLDELDTPWRDRFVRRLGTGVHLVLSCRAATGAEPAPLQPWLQGWSDGAGQAHLPIRSQVPGLSPTDTLIWLEELIGHLARDEMEALARAVQATTDGLPIFISLVLGDLKARLPDLADREARIAFLQGLPQPFADYAARALRQMSTTLGPGVLPALFSVLAKARAPLPLADLTEIVLTSALVRGADRMPAIGIKDLGPSVIRWLDVREAGLDHTLAFMHPRLAMVFAQALGPLADKAEAALAAWARVGWQMAGAGEAHAYALRYLPAHELALGGPAASIKLLMDEPYISRRLEGLGILPAAAAMQTDWRAIPISAATDSASLHQRFWLNVHDFPLTALGEGPLAVRSVLVLMADVGLNDAPAALSIRRPDLVPMSLATLVSGSDYCLALGAMELRDGRILSWHSSKTLKLWTAEGAALRTLGGHWKSVEGALELHDGRILSWSADGTLRLWTKDGAFLSSLEGHRDSVEGALELRDGRILSWSADGTLSLWTTADGDEAGILEGHDDAVRGALELRDGRMLSWSADGTLRLWTADGDEAGVLEGHDDEVRGALELGDGRILSWSRDDTLRLWTKDGAVFCNMDSHRNSVKGAKELRDGRILSRHSSKGYGLRTANLKLWTADGAALSTMGGHWKSVEGALELRDGRMLSWSGERTLQLWGADGAAAGILAGHDAAVLGALELHDGRILSWSADGTLRLWTADMSANGALEGHDRWVGGALKLRDGRILSWSEDTTLRLWTADGAAATILEGHDTAVLGALELSDGRILSWSEDTTLRLWTAEGAAAGIQKVSCEQQVDGVLELRDGRLLCWDVDWSMQLWTAEEDDARELKGHGDRVVGALELGDGRILSWSGDTTLRLWTADGDQAGVLEGHNYAVLGALELRDGRILSWSHDYTLQIWTKDGAFLSSLEGHRDSVEGALELRDGRILSWSWDESLMLWTSDGVEIGALQGFQYRVQGALELRDGRILSRSSDVTTSKQLSLINNHNTLQLWSTDGDLLAIWACPAGPITQAIMHDDQRAIVTAGHNVLLLNLDRLAPP